MPVLMAVWICVSAVAGDPHMSESFVWGMYQGHMAIAQDHKSAWAMAEVACRMEHEEGCATRCWKEVRE